MRDNNLLCYLEKSSNHILLYIDLISAGTLLLYQATLPLLLESSSPKFVHIGSQMGSIARMEDLPGRVGAYGASKAMVHFLVRKMHHENPGLCAFTVDPGYVLLLARYPH